MNDASTHVPSLNFVVCTYIYSGYLIWETTSWFGKWFLKTGGLLSQVNQHWNIKGCLIKGLSKQVVSLDSGLSNQVALYCTIPECWLHVEIEVLWVYSSILRAWTDQRGSRSPNSLGACSLLKGPHSPSTTQHSGKPTWAGQQLSRIRCIRSYLHMCRPCIESLDVNCKLTNKFWLLKIALKRMNCT